MTNYYDVQRALINVIVAAYPNVPTSFPEQELSDEDKPDGLWLALHDIPVSTTPVTVGDKGEDEALGIFQIDVNMPSGRGTGPTLQKADEIASMFTSGKSLLYNAQEVRVRRTEINPGRRVGGYYRISVSINYFARFQRNP